MTPETEHQALAIIQRNAEANGHTVADLCGPSRKQKFMKARIDSAVQMRELKIPLTEIGRIMGNRHHTTIMHLLKLDKKRKAQNGN